MKRFVKGNAYNNIGYFEEHTEGKSSWDGVIFSHNIPK